MAPKYVLIIDFKADAPTGFKYEDLKANDLYEAIEEADSYFDDDIYLLKICEKYGKTVKGEYTGQKVTNYSAILCKRSASGWHINNPKNGESNTMVQRDEYSSGFRFVDYTIK